MEIKKAASTDAAKLTQLTLKSKDYWNYGSQQIEQWREELTLTPEYIQENQVYTFTVADQLVGFYAYAPEDSKTVHLNFLFVDPEHIGKGYGKRLMTHFLEQLVPTPYERVLVEADPNAKDFYARMGFKVVGQLQSSIQNRFLPLMELSLKYV